MQQEKSIYLSLQQLVWSSFIGLLSFQVIAPHVWTYASRFLGLSFSEAYWIFNACYTFIVPAAIALWFLYNWTGFNACLGMFATSGKKDLLCKIYLNGFIAILALQITMGGYFIWFGFDQFESFKSFAIASAILVVALIFLGFYMAWKRMDVYVKKESDTNNLRKKYWQHMTVLALTVMVMMTFVGTFFSEKGKVNYGTDENRLEIGFHLLALKSELTSMRSLLRTMEEQKDLAMQVGRATNVSDSSRETLSYLQHKPTLESFVKLVNDAKAMAKLLDDIQRELDDHTMVFDPGRTDSVNSELVRLANLAKEIKSNRNRIQPKSSPQDTTTLRGNPKLFKIPGPDHGKPQSTSEAVASGSHAGTDAAMPKNEFTVIRTFVDALEREINYTAQKSLGMQLRDTQTKLVIIFSGIFCSMLAIYILLRIDNLLKEDALARMNERKRTTVWRNTMAEKKFEKDVISADRNAVLSRDMAGKAWLFITLLVWLLIPLFKVVEDEKINTASPFNTLTFGRIVSYGTENNTEINIDKSDRRITFEDVDLWDLYAEVQLVKRDVNDVFLKADSISEKVDSIAKNTRNIKLQTKDIQEVTKKTNDTVITIKSRIKKQ
jgi:hypothetical protein